MKLLSTVLVLHVSSLLSGQALMQGHSTANGVTFWYETRLEPPAPRISSSSGGILTENNVIKRHLCDFAQRTYFGYDLTVEPLPEDQYRFKFSPLTITPQKMGEIFDKVKDWKLLPLPQNPATQVLHAGDTIALDLFVNPSTGQRIVEYIRVTGGQGRYLSASGPGRDFAAEDALLELSEPRLLVNGKPVDAAGKFNGSVSGRFLWIYLSGRGRFIFSLTSRSDSGFQKAGELRGSNMIWRWGGDEFSLNASKRIAPGGGAYNLYLFHDLNYRPQRNDSFAMGAGGALESLLKR